VLGLEIFPELILKGLQWKKKVLIKAKIYNDMPFIQIK
jgi:hypothetical protein